ncbi:hypothetical protein D9M71_162460 [compost metagenome]
MDLPGQAGQQAPAGGAQLQLAEQSLAGREVATKRGALEVEGHMVDGIGREDLAGAGRVHQRHVAGRQLDAQVVLTHLGMPAAIDDQEAVAVLAVVAAARLAGNAPGIGADVRQLQGAALLQGDLADEALGLFGRRGIEVPADALQILLPVVEALADGVEAGHATPPACGAETRISRVGSGNIVNMLAITAPAPTQSTPQPGQPARHAPCSVATLGDAEKARAPPGRPGNTWADFSPWAFPPGTGRASSPA